MTTEIRKIAEEKIWNNGNGLVQMFDLSPGNRNALMREKVIGSLVGTPDVAHKLLYHLEEARNEGLPLSVLEFVRFGGLMARRKDSLRFKPHLAFWSSSSEERRKQVQEYRDTVATFCLTIPGFVLEDILRVSEGLSFYLPDFPIEEEFWEPHTSLMTHFILRDEGHHQLNTFQKLLRLGLSPEKARLFLGANFYRKVWIQGDRPSFDQLFEEKSFAFPQTFKVVTVMKRLVIRERTQPSLFDEMDEMAIHH